MILRVSPEAAETMKRLARSFSERGAGLGYPRIHRPPTGTSTLAMATVRKTFKYKLIPTPEQERALEIVLWRCRALYNSGLEERKLAWEKCQVSVSFAMPSAQLPAIKEARPEYRDINAQALQDVLHRLDTAFQAF